MDVAFDPHALRRHQAADVIRPQHAVYGFVVAEAVLPSEPIGGFFAFFHRSGDFFGRFGRAAFVSIDEENPAAARLFDGEGLLSAPVAVHGAAYDPRAACFGNFFGVVGAEVVDDDDFSGKSAAFDAFADVCLFVSGQNQYADVARHGSALIRRPLERPSEIRRCGVAEPCPGVFRRPGWFNG